MGNNGVCPNVVTFNTLINGFCKEGKLHEGNRVFSVMKVANVAPNTEMGRNQVKADILTYNALILGLCKDGKTKKAASLIKELDKENLVPNSSTFSALITGQSMIRSGCSPNENTFQMLISAFCKNDDFDGAVQVLRDMLHRVITPDSSILSELYSGLCRCGRKQLALKLCSEMEARHLLPEGFDKEKIDITENETNN
ncbi:Tetratricopeptide-like helical domain superfamily [Sesbania bispinosa]|nr:Tetratricopeptide-like helical domain superfamily [Sesbania bispinosa]